MLFQSDEYEDKILKEVEVFERKRGVKVIYGAMVGSISKGLQLSDSDYDTRFLYINNDFPQKIINPVGIDESKIVYREYYENEATEWIPYWEFSSFLSFYKVPEIDKFSYGLYSIVGWTFNSPYSWDPFGIQNIVMPVLQTVFHKDYSIGYYKEFMEYSIQDNEKVLIKEYLYALHSALMIEWMIKYNTFPPVYMKSLLVLHSEFYDSVVKYISLLRSKDNKCLGLDKMHQKKKTILVDRIGYIDEYIEKMKKVANDYSIQRLSKEQLKKIDTVLDLLYKNVSDCINGEEKVKLNY